MSNKVKLILYTEILCIIQIVLFLFPILLTTRFYMLAFLIPVNALLSWFVIKKVEKMYYKKYNTLSSLLYNICPLIGITILYIINAVFIKSEALFDLTIYYVLIFIVIYILNFVYILNCLKHKK